MFLIAEFSKAIMYPKHSTMKTKPTFDRRSYLHKSFSCFSQNTLVLQILRE